MSSNYLVKVILLHYEKMKTSGEETNIDQYLLKVVFFLKGLIYKYQLKLFPIIYVLS